MSGYGPYGLVPVSADGSEHVIVASPAVAEVVDWVGRYRCGLELASWQRDILTRLYGLDTMERMAPTGQPVPDDRHPRAQRGEIPVSTSLLGSHFPQTQDGTYLLHGERYEVAEPVDSDSVTWLRAVNTTSCEVWPYPPATVGRELVFHSHVTFGGSRRRRRPDPIPPSPSADDTLARIDETLTFFSAGLGEEVVVSRSESAFGWEDRPVYWPPLPQRVEANATGTTASCGHDWQPWEVRVALCTYHAAVAARERGVYRRRERRRERQVDPYRLRLRAMHAQYRQRRRRRW